MSDTAKHRRHPRYEVSGVEGKLAFTTVVDIVNISLSGMAVQTDKPLKIGQSYAIRLIQGQESLQLTGQAKWCRLRTTRRRGPDEIEPVYEAGFAFEDVLSATGDELVDFLHDAFAVKPNMRLAGRFKVKAKDQAKLEAEHRFVVKKISLSGMSIEAEASPEPEALCDLEIDLGDGVFRSGARIVGVRGSDTRHGVFLAGIEFIGTAREARLLLEAFIMKQVQGERS